MEKTIITILQEIRKITGDTAIKLYSPALGPVKLVSIQGNYIYCQKIGFSDSTQSITFNQNGKLDEAGECMLFPNQDCRDWNRYLDQIIFDYQLSKLVPGEICLVKDSVDTSWTLALFVNFDNKEPLIRQGLEEEKKPYVISWSDNKELLGRTYFPEWYPERFM